MSLSLIQGVRDWRAKNGLDPDTGAAITDDVPKGPPPRLVPDNPWREAWDERQWVHVPWTPKILTNLINSAGQILGEATYITPMQTKMESKPWPRDAQYMATWYDHATDLIIQRYCHPNFDKVPEGGAIPSVIVHVPALPAKS